ncbi:hypothetical protein KKH42_01380, partial [bacterium]|nr:hypothetical protein [bacterium]
KTQLEAQLVPLAGDLGAALGGGMYEPVKNGGLLGFDIGIRTSFAGISQETKTSITGLKDSSYIPAVWLYASKGLPLGIDIFARYASLKMESSAETIDLLGVGVQYTVLKDSLINPIPGVSLLLAVNNLSAPGLDAQTISAAATVSKKLPIITPFATLAMDKTTMEVLTFKPEKTQVRILAGIELRLIPFTYFNIAASKSGSETGFQLGIGIKN